MHFQYQGKTLSSAIDKCNALNNYFTSVFTKEKSINHQKLSHSLKSVTQSLTSISISQADTLKALTSIDPTKSCGPDDIPGRLLREGAIHLSKPLTKLFNMSIQQGKLPQEWKISNITPIFKKGQKSLPSNYRPISLTSIVIKTLERVIHRKVYDYLSDCNILSSSQHGFRAQHSCQTQLLETIHDWAKSIDNKSSTHVRYLPRFFQGI